MTARIKVYVAPPMEAALAAVDHGGQESSRLNTVAERYMAMVADELARLELTHQEWCTVMDANNGVQAIGDDTHASMVWANIADTPGLGEKWGIAQSDLVRRLRALPRSTLIAIVEACDRFWSRSDLPTDAALAAAGIRRTAGREQLAIPVMALGMARMLRSRRLARRYPGAGEDDQQAGDGEVAV